MAIQPIIDAEVWLNGYDLAATTNSIEVAQTRAQLDVTNFDSGGNGEYISGRRSTTVTIAGFYDGSTSEAAFTAALGNVDNHLSLTGDDGEGDFAVFCKGFDGSLTRLGGEPGNQAAPLSAELMSNDKTGVVSGIILKPKSTVSADGTTTGVQHGAVTSGQVAYAILHVFEVTGGGTLDVAVESDDNSGFTSATSRIAFTNATGVTSEFGSVAGAVTDDYWRVDWNLDTGTATFAVVFGIK